MKLMSFIAFSQHTIVATFQINISRGELFKFAINCLDLFCIFVNKLIAKTFQINILEVNYLNLQ